MTFQALDYKGKNFLDLNDDDNLPTRPTYSKGGAWLKYFGHSNIVKIVDDGLYFIFPFHFILFYLSSFLFLFPFLEQLRLGFISHAVTSVTN